MRSSIFNSYLFLREKRLLGGFAAGYRSHAGVPLRITVLARHLPVTEGNETLPPNKRSAHVPISPDRLDRTAHCRAGVPRTADPSSGRPVWIERRNCRT